MGKRLFITEKPSVAMEFVKALKMSSKRENGYIEDNNTIVTWCIGHLVTMSYPEKYGEEYKAWKMETLPFLPKSFRYEVIDSVRDQFRVVMTLMQRNDVDTIFYSGDAGREGEYIQRLVRQFTNLAPGVSERRVWIDSQTEEEILRGIREAKDIKDYDSLSDSAYMRAAEDYLFGINLSRAYSVRYGTLFNNIVDTPKYEPIAVGRVMTCVLGMVVNRERLIKGTKEIPFYGVKAILSNNLAVDWKTTEQSPYFESPLLYKSGAFSKRKDAEDFVQKLNVRGKLSLMKKDSSKEKKSAPLLYNLAELQGECSAELKISPDTTLNVVQSLYEKKMVTYPRTDARVLSSAIAKEVRKNIDGLASLSCCESHVQKVLSYSMVDNIGQTKYTNDKLITDHYAIIPTGQGVSQFSGLSQTEKAVYQMICLRFLAIFCPEAEYKKITCTFLCEGETFQISTKTLEIAGFLELYEIDKADHNVLDVLQSFEEGEIYDVTFQLAEGKTSPPKRYTSGSMILSMENAGQLIEDMELRATIKGSGIGTSATRSDVIKKLVKNKYLLLNEKTQVLTSGERGEIIYDIVNAVTPSLLKPEMTANWEKGLSMIQRREVSKDEYFHKLCDYVTREVNAVKNSDVEKIRKCLPEEKKKNSQYLNGHSQKMDLKINFTKNHPNNMPEDCPHCNGKMADYDWGTICRDCGAKVPKVVFGVTLSEKERTDLLYSGETSHKVKGFHKKDNSGTYDAKLKMEDGWNTRLCFK